MRQKQAMPKRRTCQLIRLVRSSLQYRALRENDDDLRLPMIRLAKSYRSYGYHKVLELQRTEGWSVNHKKLERLCSEEGLQKLQRHKKRKRLYHHEGSIIRLRPTHPNRRGARQYQKAHQTDTLRRQNGE